MSRQDRSNESQPTSTAPILTSRDLSRDALVTIVSSIQGRMYLDLDESGCKSWNPGKEWSCADVCQDVQDILYRYGLVPGDEQPYEDEASGMEGDFAQLIELAEASGLERSDLDDIVYECVAATASTTNNSGLWGQIEYLLDQLGHADVRTRLSEVAGTGGGAVAE